MSLLTLAERKGFYFEWLKNQCERYAANEISLCNRDVHKVLFCAFPHSGLASQNMTKFLTELFQDFRSPCLS